MATLRSSAPVFQVGDVGTTMKWYADHLGFEPHPFPASPPHAFCILSRDSVEIMLQRVNDHEKLDTYRRRKAGVWHVYLRMRGVRDLYALVQKDQEIRLLEPLKQQPYGDTEFVVEDPNGYVLVFSE